LTAFRAAAFATVLVVAWLACAAPARALNGRWQPPDIHPKTVSLAEVLATYRRGLGNPEARYAQRIEHYALANKDLKLTATFTVRNDEFVASTSLDGAVYDQGLSRGLRWRRTPAGLVRIIESDIQGDDLDRWPLALLPILDADCALVGESAGSSPAWVVEYRPPHGYPHWFYIDEKSGLITREVMREGSRVTSIAFDDFRPIAGTQRPYRWRLSGAGGPLDVSVEEIDLVPVARKTVEIPLSRTDFAPFAGPSAPMPAAFSRINGIKLKTSLNGHTLNFLLDTGTTQIIVDDGVARRLGIRSTFGHAVAKELAVGSLRIENANILTVPLFDNLDGILGYDFFAGHVVHVDFHHFHVDVIDRATFSPPAAAWLLEAGCDEGLPMIAVPFGGAVARRFVLDTGSPDLLFSQYLSDRDGISFESTGLVPMSGPGGQQLLEFLEGPVAVRRATLPSIRIGPATIRGVPTWTEQLNAGERIELPIDGVIGTRILSLFEWWFDYDGNRLWFRPV
jgi:hypothetical protein